jgi:hypothetical protein
MELQESKEIESLFNEAISKVDLNQVSPGEIIGDVLNAINTVSFRLMVASAILHKIQARDEGEKPVQAQRPEESVSLES